MQQVVEHGSITIDVNKCAQFMMLGCLCGDIVYLMSCRRAEILFSIAIIDGTLRIYRNDITPRNFCQKMVVWAKKAAHLRVRNVARSRVCDIDPVQRFIGSVEYLLEDLRWWGTAE
jgi:hypothetical protein